MSTIFKKAAALFALVAVVLAGVVSATPAYAEGAGKLTVTSTDAGFNGAKVDAWQMFTAKKNGSAYTFEVAESWKTFFTNTADGYPNIQDNADFDANAADYVRKLEEENNAATLETFAKLAAAWAKNNNIAVTTKATAVGTPEDNPTSYVATFSNLDFGYYLVKPYASGEKPGSSRGTDAMLISVVDDNATITLKNTYPTVDKTVEDGDKGDGAQVGDEVTFTLTSKVPDTSEFSSYIFRLKDTLSEGLTFNNDAKVTIGGTELKGSDYTVTQPSAENGNTVTFDLSSYIKPANGTSSAKAGETITVTYTATLNEKASTDTTNGNTNSAKVEYTNGPSTDDIGTSTPSVTHTYTFHFDLKKVDGDNEALAGAVFQLMRKGADGNYSVVKLAAVTSDGTISYRPAKTDDEAGATDTVTTPNNGIIKFTGLDDGTYKLVETQAPDGYNKAADTEFTIHASYKDDGTLSTWSIDNVSNGTMTIVNRKGTLLPSTGGMGTVVFTVAGSAIVIAGAAWFAARRRAQN